MKTILTFKQLALHLGVSLQRIYKMREDPISPLPHFRIGKKSYRVYLEDVMAWLETRTKEIEGASNGEA